MGCQHWNGYQHCQGCKRQFLRTWNLTIIAYPTCLSSHQPSPPDSLSDVSICSPPHLYHTPFTTPGSHARHTQLSKTLYSRPHTTCHTSTPSHHPMLFPIFLRGHNTSRSKSPGFFQIFYPANAPQPHDKICTHLHRLYVRKKVTSILPGLVWFDSILLWLY
jgi:hypothetical protein